MTESVRCSRLTSPRMDLEVAMYSDKRKNRQPAGIFPACLLCACVINGCSGSGQDFPAPESPTTAPPAQQTSTNRLDGHFSGLAELPDGTHHVEALITVDGAVRLYVGGPLPTGTILSGGGIPTELLAQADGAMFAGNIAPTDDQGAGSGLVFGMSCDGVAIGRFCDQPAVATIEIATTESGFAFEIDIATSRGNESWHLDVGKYSNYYDLGVASPPSGLYRETLAQFAQAGEVVLRIDVSGTLFFQSPDSGCTGNGAVLPHLDGNHAVWDVSLIVENCAGLYGYLNGSFDGLATISQGGYWDYDVWLLLFLAGAESTSSRIALFSYGQQL